MSDTEHAELIDTMRRASVAVYAAVEAIVANDLSRMLRRAADALASLSAPVIVRTVDELDALPDKAVIRESVGYVLESFAGLWYRGGSGYPSTDITLPATVLFTPTESGEPQ